MTPDTQLAIAALHDLTIDHDVIRVDRNTGTEFYEVCPHDGVEWVDKDRLRQWAIDGRAIADLLASSMARGGSSETLLPGVAWRIGDMRIDGETFSVVLTTTRSAPTLAGRSGASRMILVGDELPREGFAGCLSMTEAFAMSYGQIESRPHRFQQVLPLFSVRSGNAFYRKGQMWVVRFRGNETFLENNVGPLYIARLRDTSPPVCERCRLAQRARGRHYSGSSRTAPRRRPTISIKLGSGTPPLYAF